jgi:hypothetical protein
MSGMKVGEAYYLQIRDQIKHEDNLSNNRMTWLISLQSFLFAAYGIAANGTKSELIDAARIAFSLTGIFSSIAITLALFAAKHSVNKLVEAWFATEYFKHRSKDDYPPIIGTYSEENSKGTRLGFLPLLMIPLFCSCSWLVILSGVVPALVCTGLLLVAGGYLYKHLDDASPKKPNKYLLRKIIGIRKRVSSTKITAK